MNEPTLHLTIGVKNQGNDLLHWLVDRQRANGAAERDVPCRRLGRTHPLQRTDSGHAVERARRRPGGIYLAETDRTASRGRFSTFRERNSGGFRLAGTFSCG